jgi:opacity protein-like surface antigen
MLSVLRNNTTKWAAYTAVFVFSILSTPAGATAPSNSDLHSMIMGLKHEMNLLKKENVNLRKRFSNLIIKPGRTKLLIARNAPVVNGKTNVGSRSILASKSNLKWNKIRALSPQKNGIQLAALNKEPPKTLPKWYVAPRAFYSSPNDVSGSFNSGKTESTGSVNLSDGVGLGFGIGHRFTKNWRAEFEASRTVYDVQSLKADDGSPSPFKLGTGSAAFNNLMINGYYDFESRRKLTPYIGAGIGASFLQAKDIAFSSTGGDNFKTTGSETVWIPTAKATLGIAYELNRDLSLDLAYRLGIAGDLSGSRPEKSGDSNILLNHNFMAGLRYNFDVDYGFDFK